MLCATQSQGVIPQSLYSNRVVVVNKDFDKQKLVKVGDFVISLRSFEGGIEYAYYQGIISAAYTILTPRESDYAEYYKYLFKCYNFIQLLQTCVTGIREGQNINYPLLSKQHLPIPPLDEQKKIVEYLSTKTSQIDAQQRERERELRLLDELKQAEIANVVTRGLNPDVPMKDSGIFWLPYVPVNWSVHKLKYILTRLERNREPNSELLICSNSGKVYPRGEAKLGLVSDDETIYQGVKAGDLLIHGMDTWHGAVGISDYDGMCTPVVHVCDSKENKKFIYYYLRYMAHQKVFKLISNGVRQNTSDFRSWDKLASILIPVPPIEEQNAIVAYIESKDSAIDEMIANLRAEIDFLTEYKQRLIADVVTGQINVQNITTHE